MDAEIERLLRDRGKEFWSASVAATDEPTGYYCVPSNHGIVMARAPFIAFLDADNEWTPNHLSGLLRAIRTPDPDDWLPAFVYSRRHYIRDEGLNDPELPHDIDTPLRPWTKAWINPMLSPPFDGIVDSSDLLVSKSALFHLAESTGTMWNPNCRRFGWILN